MTTHDSNPKKHGTHAAEAPSLDAPVGSETGAKLLALFGLTEREALFILGTTPVTPDEIAAAQPVSIAALGAALDPATVQAVVTDGALDLGALKEGFATAANNVHVCAGIEDKLQHVLETLHGATRVDAAQAGEVVTTVVTQLRGRARVNPTVRTTYSSLLAYQKARYPGRHAAHPAPEPTAPGAPATPPPAPTTSAKP